MTDWLVVSDLDGSLLDHDTYRWDAAADVLSALGRLSIPLVLNTSKTRSELADIRSALGNDWPYVIENGAAIVCDNAEPGLAHSFGLPRGRILEVLADCRQAGFGFESFADMGVQGVVKHTGLTVQAAMQALQREYTEPLLWNDTAPRLADFRKRLELAGLRLIRGGRFYHVSGPGDKGTATAYLREWWPGSPRIVALGDGENDVPMLEMADVAVLIANPSGVTPSVKPPAGGLIRTEQPGPSGWAKALREVLALAPD